MRAMDTVHGPLSNFLNSPFIRMFFLNKPNSLTFHFPTKIFQKKKSPPTACLKFHKSGLNQCNLLLRMDLNLKIQREITSQEPRKLCFSPPEILLQPGEVSSPLTLSGSGRSSPVRRLRPGPGGGRREPGPQAARQPCPAVRGRTAPQGCRSQRGQRRGGRSPPCSPAGESLGPGRPDTCGHLPLLRSLFRFIRSDVFEMELCPSLFAQGEESENERLPRA